MKRTRTTFGTIIHKRHSGFQPLQVCTGCSSVDVALGRVWGVLQGMAFGGYDGEVTVHVMREHPYRTEMTVRYMVGGGQWQQVPKCSQCFEYCDIGETVHLACAKKAEQSASEFAAELAKIEGGVK